ncbi:MAG: sporulation protein YqfD [Clostridia bacterium]|nr:sporulation protein YqfD [Clostridia bacterium]
MRKDIGNRTGGRLVKSTYLIKGLNLDRFINIVQKKGISLYDVKKIGVKRMLITVNFYDCEKFFAIAKDLCYNIKKIRDKGIGYPVFYLLRNFGLIFGAIIFIATAIFFNDIIFELSFSGSGKIYSREVKQYLQSVGVTEYKRFSKVDLNLLGDDILKSNSHLSFATCKKNGNRLEIELVLSKDKVETLNGNLYALYSDVDGVVESVKVYRGTALVVKGDVVKKGDLLVGGYAVIKEQTIKMNVLATVSVIMEKEFIYLSDKDNEEDKARLFAEEEIDKEIVSGKTIKSFENNKYVYKTTLKIRRVLFAG